MELRVSEPRTRIIRGLYDIRGGRNWKFLFLLFSIFFRFIYFPRKTRLDDESDGLCTTGVGGGGGRWRARNMRHSNRWNALGLHFPRVWQWQPVESSRNARVPRPRLSSKTNFLARARVSAREFERVLFAKFRLRLQSTQSENSDGWLIKGRIRDGECLKGLNACSGEIYVRNCVIERRGRCVKLRLISAKFETDDLTRLNRAELMNFASAWSLRQF